MKNEKVSKFNRGIRLLLCVTNIFSKYVSVFPLQDKEGVTISNVFQNNINESNRKPNKIWVDKGSEFYSVSMKSWLEEKRPRNVFNT